MMLCLFTVIAPAYSQVKDKDSMVRKIFSVIQQKDRKGFVKLFPDAATLIKAAEVFFAGKKKEELDEILPMLTDSSLQMKFGEMFSEIMDKGMEKGFDWSQTSLVSFLTDTSFNKETKMPVMKGKIYFNTDKKEYFMIYDEIIWFENLGWYGVNIDRIDEKSKENDPEEMKWSPGEDSVMMTVDTAIAMPDTAIKVKVVKPIKKTNPVKPAGKPVKVKSQTPAKKPE